MTLFRIKYLIIAILVILTPFYCFALEEMTDTEMGDVTGQMGVSMTFTGDLSARFKADGIAWGDTDGFAGASGAGYIVLGNHNSVFRMRDDSELTIDVSAGNLSLSHGGSISNGSGYIRIGLPRININYEFESGGDPKTAVSLVGGSASGPNWGAASSANAIGYLWVEDFEFAVHDGAMYIVPH